MIRATVLADPASFHSADEATAWLRHAYPLAVRDHAIWTSRAHQVGDTGLARYFDYGDGPVPEMRDAKYLQDVIRWLLTCASPAGPGLPGQSRAASRRR